jgi:multiple sugar transport system ATP-binding protein
MDEPLSNLDAKLRVQMRTEISRIQQQLETTTIYVTHDQTEAMTLGDRIAVMRAGILQQVGPPSELYGYPSNLFVAGFIGSPSMNFVEAELAEGLLRTPLGDVPLPDQLRRSVEASAADRHVIMGVRPEHFEDAALVSDRDRAHGITFTTDIDLIESVGSDVFAHFTLDSGAASTTELTELAADTGSAGLPEDGLTMVARLNAETKIKEEDQATLWFDTSKIQLFDPPSGRSLITPVV